MNSKRLDELIEHTLFEAPEDEQDEKPEETEQPKNVKPKDEKEAKKKSIEQTDKDDLKDEEEPEDKEVAVSVKMNRGAEGAGQIKLIDYQKLSSLTSIESLLKLFDIDPDKAPPGFKDKMEITINSPLKDFKEEEYNITLMDKIGQIAIRRPDFKTTITKKSTGMGGGNLGQAVEQGLPAGGGMG